MIRRQTSLQVTEATERQVEYLRSIGYGAFTEIARIAIDRMHTDERRNEWLDRGRGRARTGDSPQLRRPGWLAKTWR